MEWEKLHLIKNEKCFLAFYYPTYALIEVNEFTYKVLERVKVGDAIENIITSFEIDKNDFHDLLCTLESLFNIIPNKKMN